MQAWHQIRDGQQQKEYGFYTGQPSMFLRQTEITLSCNWVISSSSSSAARSMQFIRYPCSSSRGFHTGVRHRIEYCIIFFHALFRNYRQRKLGHKRHKAKAVSKPKDRKLLHRHGWWLRHQNHSWRFKIRSKAANTDSSTLSPCIKAGNNSV